MNWKDHFTDSQIAALTGPGAKRSIRVSPEFMREYPVYLIVGRCGVNLRSTMYDCSRQQHHDGIHVRHGSLYDTQTAGMIMEIMEP
jgi:hypothetical protein